MDDDLDLLGRYGFCPYCLAIRNYHTTVRARSSKLTEFAPQAILTDVRALIAWLHGKLGEYAGQVRFEMGDTIDRFIPVAIMHGSPVCVVDLWQLTEPGTRTRR